MKSYFLTCCLLACTAPAFAGDREARIGDIAHFEGIRDNSIIGYGLVVGLNGTGDRKQSLISVQALASALKKMGIQVPAGALTVSNVAAVFATATLPPFARQGMHFDVTVSSMADAKSLEGGMLLLTPLSSADGQVYASAQGSVALGGYSVASGGASKQLNHPTVGRVPAGGIVERDAAIDLRSVKELTLVLSEPDFGTAERIASTLRDTINPKLATLLDSRTITIHPETVATPVPELLAKVESLHVIVGTRAKIVMNERTGTVVLGGDVALSPVSIMHGGLSIEIQTQYSVSQPGPLSQLGTTAVIPQTTVKADDKPASQILLKQGATVEDLVRGLQKIGATGRDVISILQAVKAAGGLHADIEVL
ncbi:MAG: flagellar basal body P-ring protein FlgI [Acidobacteriaceae bacterium]